MYDSEEFTLSMASDEPAVVRDAGRHGPLPLFFLTWRAKRNVSQVICQINDGSNECIKSLGKHQASLCMHHCHGRVIQQPRAGTLIYGDWNEHQPLLISLNRSHCNGLTFSA